MPDWNKIKETLLGKKKIEDNGSGFEHTEQKEADGKKGSFSLKETVTPLTKKEKLRTKEVIYGTELPVDEDSRMESKTIFSQMTAEKEGKTVASGTFMDNRFSVIDEDEKQSVISKYDEEGHLVRYGNEKVSENPEAGEITTNSDMMDFDQLGQPQQFVHKYVSKSDGVETLETNVIDYENGKPVKIREDFDGYVTDTSVKKDGSSLSVDGTGKRIERGVEETKKYIEDLIPEEIREMAEDVKKINGLMKEKVTSVLDGYFNDDKDGTKNPEKKTNRQGEKIGDYLKRMRYNVCLGHDGENKEPATAEMPSAEQSRGSNNENSSSGVLSKEVKDKLSKDLQTTR